EDAALAKGLVKREVTRVVTPGTITEDELLDPRENNFIAAVAPGKQMGLAWLELSTGRFMATEISPEDLADELARLQPAECLIPEGSRDASSFESGTPFTGALRQGMPLTERPIWN